MTEYSSAEEAAADAAANASSSSSSPGTGLLSTSTALIQQAAKTSQPLFESTWNSIRTALAESQNPWLTTGGLVCLGASVLNSLLGEFWILRPLLSSANSAVVDISEEKSSGGSSSSFFGLGKSSASVAPPVSAPVAAARKSVIIVEKNAQTLRVAFHLFSTLLGGMGGLLIVLGRPPGSGSSRDLNKERDMIKVLTGTFTVAAIIITLLGGGHGGILKTPAFPTLGPLAVLMALALARHDRNAVASGITSE